MKKFIFSFSLIFMLVLSFVTVSYAYDVIIFNNNAANYMAVQMFLQKTGHVVLDVRPSVSAFTDKVEISYDDLSSICTTLSFTANRYPRSSYATAFLTIYPRWDDSGAWLGWYNGNTLLSDTGEPSRRLLTAPPETGSYYIYGTTDSGIDVVYASRFTGFLQSQSDRVVNAIGSIPQPETMDLTTIETTLSTICDKLDNTASNVENTVINITEENNAFNAFYITGDDGETQPITEFAKDLSGASGKFLSVLYRLVFSDALDSADSDLGNLEDFFTSTEPVEDTAMQSADSTHEEVDIWSAF